jgi:hypothetical protein
MQLKFVTMTIFCSFPSQSLCLSVSMIHARSQISFGLLSKISVRFLAYGEPFSLLRHFFSSSVFKVSAFGPVVSRMSAGQVAKILNLYNECILLLNPNSVGALMDRLSLGLLSHIS